MEQSKVFVRESRESCVVIIQTEELIILKLGGKMQYKTVAAPIEFEVKSGDTEGTQKACQAYADILQREANDGWEFVSVQQIPVTEKPGCLAGFFGQKTITTYFNMLIFKK